MYYVCMKDRREQYKEYHRRAKDYELKIKPRREAWVASHCCEICGSKEDLHLHHVDPTKKISHRIWSWSDARREAELEKCIALCRKCHQEHHRQEMIKHGTVSRYSRGGCRCELCRAAKAADNARRDRRKNKNGPNPRHIANGIKPY